MAEFAEYPEEMNVEKHGMDEKSVGVISVQCSTPWEVYVDGAANQRGSGMGLVLMSLKRLSLRNI